MDHKVNVDLQVDVVSLELMDHLAPKVSLVMLDLLDLMAKRDVKEIQAHLVYQVGKV